MDTRISCMATIRSLCSHAMALLCFAGLMLLWPSAPAAQDVPVPLPDGTPMPNPTSPDAGAKKKDEPETLRTLRGRIVRVLPRSDGGCILTIAEIRKRDGVWPGATGVIVGLGAKIKVTESTRKGLKAVTEAELDEVLEYSIVEIKVPAD